MKPYILNIILLILTWPLLGGIHDPDTDIQDIVLIPDTNFKEALLTNPEINVNGDNAIQAEEAATFDGQIHVAGENISDLTGIEAFTSLTDLRAHYNALTTVDLSENAELQELHLQNNQLASVDLSHNTQLVKVRLMNNIISSLDLSANEHLRQLEVNNNMLTSLDVRNGNNQFMYKLVTLGNPGLKCITVDDIAQAEVSYSESVDPGTSFSVSCGTPEEDPDISSFQPTIAATSSTDLPLPESAPDKSLELIGDDGYDTYKWFRDDMLVQSNSNEVLVLNNEAGDQFDPSTDVGDYTLIVTDNEANESMASEPVTITYTEPGENDDEIVYVPDGNFKAALLANAAINTNGDTEIQASEAVAYTGQINLAGQGIADLTGIEAFTALKDLRIHYNTLSSVNLTANTALVELHLQNNLLNNLNLSSNVNLVKVRLMNNNLTTLDASGLGQLRQLELDNNDLTTLDVKNGNNHRMYKLSTLGNENLECITVDDITQAEASYSSSVAAGTSFSTDCGDTEQDPEILTFTPTITATSSTSLPLPESTPDKSLDLIGNEGYTTYNWYRDNSLVQSSSSNVLQLNNEAGDQFDPATDQGNYTLIVADTEGNQSLISDPVTVTYTEPEEPEIATFKPTITASNTTDLPLPESTPDKSLDLIGNEGYPTYKWFRDNTLIQSSGSNILQLNNEEGDQFDPATDPGDYTLIVADTEGNESLIADAVTVTYTEEPQDGIVYIPDVNFKAGLVANTSININGDDQIQFTEAAAFSGQINLAGKGIADLTGIEAFTSLTDLRVHYNNLSTINLSENTALKELHLQNNQLTVPDLHSNTQLIKIRLMNNNLTSLDLSALGNLRHLEADNNSLTSLNIKNGNNQYLYKLSTLGNTVLSCITVDDVAQAQARFSDGVEPGTSFSTNCDGTGEEEPDISTFKPTITATSSTNLPLPETTADKSLDLIGNGGFNTYKWFRNNTLIQNSSSNVLSLNNETGNQFDPTTDQGNYTLIVADAAGDESLLSDPITVTYTPPDEDDDEIPTGPGQHIARGLSIRDKQYSHYYKMVSWDDSQYEEFAYWERHAGGYIVEFMNFRVKFPAGYNPADASKKYPAILMLHGAGESGRKWTGRYQYDPSDPEYDNNGHNLLHGGKQHLDAANRSPSNSRAFPGIIIFPQASYNAAWNEINLRMVFDFLDYMIEQYHVDQDKIAVHGLSAGGKGTWKAIYTRPDLFCAALPMSGVGYDRLPETDVSVTLPIWLFQGELDSNPNPSAAEAWIEMLRQKGGTPRYTMYENVGHETWNRAYNEPDFFSWIRSQDKKNIHVMGGKPAGCANPVSPLELGFSSGFLAYQWTRNGQNISGANSRFLTAQNEGTYSVKFQRRDGSWAESFPIEVCYAAPATMARKSGSEEPLIYASGPTALPVSDAVSVDKTLQLIAPSGFVRYKWYRNGRIFNITKDSVLILNDSSGDLFSASDTGIYTANLWDRKGMMQESQAVTVTYNHSGIEQDFIVHIDSGLTIRDKKKGHFHPMMSWDETPYKEFAYWEETELGSIVNFLNFRILFPPDYNKRDSLKLYPAIVSFHGAGESGRKFDSKNEVVFEWQPGDSEYDNNSHQLYHGGREHLSAVQTGKTEKKASYPGFVIMPQVSYNGAWSDDYVDDFAQILEYMIKEYHVDPDKIAIHGLSAGARGLWKIAATRPDLFAACLPISGVGTDLDQNTSILNTTPFWIFQGELDTNPSPGYSSEWFNTLIAKGGTPRYTLYEDIAHEVWNLAYKENDFFSWMLGQDKKKIHVMGGKPLKSCENTGAEPLKLGISAGYLEYQWMKDGQDLPNANSRFITAAENGVYRVKFKRRTDSTWAESYPLDIFYSDPNTPNLIPSLKAYGTTNLPLPEGIDQTLKLVAQPGFATYEWYKDGDLIKTSVDSILTLNDENGTLFTPADTGSYTVMLLDKNNCATQLSDPVRITTGDNLDEDPPVVEKTVLSLAEIRVDWTDTNYETAYEIWGKRNHTFSRDTSGISGYPGTKYQYLTTLPDNTTSFVVQDLRPGGQYNYLVRAIKGTSSIFSEDNEDYALTHNDETSPMKPLDLVATETGKNQVTLTWERSVDDDVVYKYVIYEGPDEIAVVIGDTVDTDPTDGNPEPINSFVLENLDEGTTYLFGVQAVDYQGNQFEGNKSGISDLAEITTSMEEGPDTEVKEGDALIFPNPFVDRITIRVKKGLNEPVTLYDYAGRVIRRSDPITESEVTMDMYGLRKGIYILNIGSKSYKLIKTE